MVATGKDRPLRDIWSVLPFLVIGMVMAYVEVTMQKEGQPWELPRTDSPLARLAGAGWSVWFYLYKLIWPLNLCFVYPRWTIDGGKLLSFVPDVLLLGAVLAAWWQRRSWGRGLFMVLFCYVALLLPVLGFVNIYFMRYSLVADHWQYAAMIAPAAGLSALLAARARRGLPSIAVTAGALVLLGCLGALTHPASGHLQGRGDSWSCVSFATRTAGWRTTISAIGWRTGGRTQEAVADNEAAVRLKPDDFQAYNNLGVTSAVWVGRRKPSSTSNGRSRSKGTTHWRARTDGTGDKRLGKCSDAPASVYFGGRPGQCPMPSPKIGNGQYRGSSLEV